VSVPHAGTVRLTVRVPGYEDWTDEALTVLENEEARLRVSLRPAR